VDVRVGGGGGVGVPAVAVTVEVAGGVPEVGVPVAVGGVAFVCVAVADRAAVPVGVRREVAVAVTDPTVVAVGVGGVGVPGVLVAVGGAEVVAVAVLVGVGCTPTRTDPSMQSVVSGLPMGSLALAFEHVSGYVPSAAFSAMAIVQVYITTGQGSTPGHSVVDAPQIGQTLSSARISALTLVQLVPTVHPGGWKANELPFLSMSGLAEHIGLPFDPAAMAACGGKVITFCVPATTRSVSKLTSTGTKLPAAPIAVPIVMVASAGTATVIEPLVQSAPTGWPSGLLPCAPEHGSGIVPVASDAMATRQV
jgi:hypothetical protein